MACSIAYNSTNWTTHIIISNGSTLSWGKLQKIYSLQEQKHCKKDCTQSSWYKVVVSILPCHLYQIQKLELIKCMILHQMFAQFYTCLEWFTMAHSTTKIIHPFTLHATPHTQLIYYNYYGESIPNFCQGNCKKWNGMEWNGKHWKKMIKACCSTLYTLSAGCWYLTLPYKSTKKQVSVYLLDLLCRVNN